MCFGFDPRPPPAGLEVGEIEAASEGALGRSASAALSASAASKKRTLTVSVNWGVRLSEESHLIGLLRQLAEEASKRLEKARLFSGRIGLRVS